MSREEEVRIKALAFALDWVKGKSFNAGEVITLAARFEEFIKYGKSKG